MERRGRIQSNTKAFEGDQQVLIGDVGKGDEQALTCVEELVNDDWTAVRSDEEALRGNEGHLRGTRRC